MALPKTEGSPDDQDHVRYEYTNQGKMPEYNLALYIVGTLAAQGLINVSSSVGYELVEHATEVVARCLEGLTNDHRARFGNDQLFDFVMSKP